MQIKTESDHCRPPAVAGLFYPENPSELSSMVSELLAGADQAQFPTQPKALVVPHAGYIYSGSVAAQGYQKLTAWAQQIRHVIVLGPNHRVPLSGIAAPAEEYFGTPLGEIKIDQKIIKQLADRELLTINSLPHKNEHCLETQLPFLQTLLNDWQLVPLIVGECTASDVAALLNELMHNPENLVIVSSDLSHFHEYSEAQTIDTQTSTLIESLRPVIRPQQACGAFPLNGLLLQADKMGLKVKLLDRQNSGDTAGNKQQVVGYGCYAFL